MISLFTEAERIAWKKPERLSPSEWAERHRVLPGAVAAEAGKLRLGRTPYMRGVLDALAEPGVEEIALLKSTQVGGSTFTESAIGHWVDNDPGPIMLVLDSEKTAKEVIVERIRPLIDSEPIKSHLSERNRDNKLDSIQFDTCGLYLAWAGSPATLARRAVRYIVFDEVDKYPHFTGKEADPISLGMERTQTYGYRRKVLIVSTPTVRTGTIWRAWEAAGDKRRFNVPCPLCGQFQTLVFGQVKFPETPANASRQLHADQVELCGLAHYECIHCREAISESARLRMIARGVWLSEGQSIDRHAKISGEKPKAKRVGFWINSLYSPWRTFSAVAAQFLRSLGDPGKLQNFRNSWLAEVWEEVLKTSSVDDFRQLTINAPPPRIVPQWAEYIVASADVQKDRMYWCVRAWGAEYKSQLITYGLAMTFEELRRLTLGTQFTLEGRGVTSPPHVLMVDSGYRRDEVYTFAQSDPRIKPVKGDNDSQQMPLHYSTAGKAWGIPLFLLNTQLLKDKLAVLRNTGRWALNSATDDEYLQHLASEHKTLVKGVERWAPKTSGAANHFLDAETYNLAGAEHLRVDLLQIPQAAPSAAAAGGAGELDGRASYHKGDGWLANTKSWLK